MQLSVKPKRHSGFPSQALPQVVLMPAGVYPGYWGNGVLDIGLLGTGIADAGVYPGDLEPSTP